MLLSIGPLGTNFSDILIKIQIFSFTKKHLKISPAKFAQQEMNFKWSPGDTFQLEPQKGFSIKFILKIQTFSSMKSLSILLRLQFVNLCDVDNRLPRWHRHECCIATTSSCNFVHTLEETNHSKDLKYYPYDKDSIAFSILLALHYGSLVISSLFSDFSLLTWKSSHGNY